MNHEKARENKKYLCDKIEAELLEHCSSSEQLETFLAKLEDWQNLPDECWDNQRETYDPEEILNDFFHGNQLPMEKVQKEKAQRMALQERNRYADKVCYQKVGKEMAERPNEKMTGRLKAAIEVQNAADKAMRNGTDVMKEIEEIIEEWEGYLLWLDEDSSSYQDADQQEKIQLLRKIERFFDPEHHVNPFNAPPQRFTADGKDFEDTSYGHYSGRGERPFPYPKEIGEDYQAINTWLKEKYFLPGIQVLQDIKKEVEEGKKE